MGCVSTKFNAFVTHHSKELFVENHEKRFHRNFQGCMDTCEKKNERRRKFEKEFLHDIEQEKIWQEKNMSSDAEKIAKYQRITITM